MRFAAALFTLLCTAGCFAPREPSVPLKSGTYRFQWKDAEFPQGNGFPVLVEISGNRVRVMNQRAQGAAPVGELERGNLMWHARSKQWILSEAESDRLPPDVGPCDPGPHIVDFDRREIWTCEWGP